jgi:DNA-binding GntR family transcriptional regulator
MAGYGLPMPSVAGYGQHVSVDHDSDVPPYQQVAAILREQILSGQIPPRRPIPSVTTLQQTYGIARGTVRKAVALLAAEGLVVLRPGWGTFVIPEDQRPRQP